MAKNLRALTIDELKYFLDRYDISIVDNYILVSCKGKNKKTIHDMKSFSLLTPVRKLTITKKAIDIWRESYMDKYSLIEVQTAMNILIITYNDINKSQLDAELKRLRSKFNNTI